MEVSMKKILFSLLVCGLFIGISTFGYGAPAITYKVDGIVGTVSLSEGETFQVQGMTGVRFNNVEIDAGTSANVLISAILDPYGFISYDIVVDDYSRASSFYFRFDQTILPTPAPGVVTASMERNSTDGGDRYFAADAGAPPSGVPVDGSLRYGEMAVYTLSKKASPLLSDLKSAGLDLGSTVMSYPASGSQTYPTLRESKQGPEGSGEYNYMRLDLTFYVTGDDDQFGIKGNATVNNDSPANPTTPTPTHAPITGAWWLLASGLAGLVLLRRKIRS
jgi:MYXO-CTERM domain-containing protein